MCTRRLKCANQRWKFLFETPKCLIRSYNHNHLIRGSKFTINNRDGNFSTRYRLDSFSGQPETVGKKICVISGKSKASPGLHTLRFYSSAGDGRNTSEDKHMPVGDRANFGKSKIRLGVASRDLLLCDEHARLGGLDQKEWLNNEKAAMETKKRESPFLTKREKFKNKFTQRVVPWKNINVSWETFPYYIHEHIKNLLVECATSHLKHKQFAAVYGSRLSSSMGRVLLQSIPGTELYRERLVRALARDLQVPVLVLDSSILAPCASDDENASSMEECTSEIDVEDENDASSREAKSDTTEDGEVDLSAVEVLKKIIPNLQEFVEFISGESKNLLKSLKPDDVQASDNSEIPLRKGDRVKYIGPSARVEDRVLLGKISTVDGSVDAYTVIHCRNLFTGQRGEVYEVEGERAAVILDIDHNIADNGVNNEKTDAEQDAKPLLCWIQAKDIERDLDPQLDCYVAMEALDEVLQNNQPLIVYFPDSNQWLSRAVPKSSREEFISKVQDMFDQLPGPILLICGQNKLESGSKEKENFTTTLPYIARQVKLPPCLRQLTEGLNESKRREDDIYKLFTNVVFLHPPKEEELLKTFNKQLEEDRHLVISRSNLIELRKVLEEHELSCKDVLHVNTNGVILTKQKAEKVVGWAKNNYLSSCLLPSIKGERLAISRESLEIAILRLKEQESYTRKPSQSLKNLAKDKYESNFISAVVPPGEIGVRFDDIGALEDVKKALNELVILPMRRPELFSSGNLLRGILLFGPPGTGKTLLAKALATEAGANFISITGSTLTSKWFGDAEKLTKALFSFASKLAPVVIFVDEPIVPIIQSMKHVMSPGFRIPEVELLELMNNLTKDHAALCTIIVDSLLGARGGASEHEATRRMRNEFMAAWDGLRTKDTQRILILGATNRPFDLDDAVIRRLPRRIYVDLPDAENRMKILKIFLSRENVEPDFEYDKLANVAEGYSGSDLKNLCIAAAYRPVQELLAAERKEVNNNLALRPLKLEDFIHSKAKVGPSVSYDAESMNQLRKWNEQYGEGGSRRQSPFGF